MKTVEDLKSLQAEAILRLNCPGYGSTSSLTSGDALPLTEYKVIIVNPVSIVHLFGEDPNVIKLIDMAQTEGHTSYHASDKRLIERCGLQIELRSPELFQFLAEGGLLIYYLCRPFVIISGSQPMDNYAWLCGLAPDQAGESTMTEQTVRHMSTVAHGRNIDKTEAARASEFNKYFDQVGLEWNTIIRTDFLTNGYSALALAGPKKCIAGELVAGEKGGRVVFLTAPYSPDFDRTLMDCISVWYANKMGVGIVNTQKDIEAAPVFQDEETAERALQWQARQDEARAAEAARERSLKQQVIRDEEIQEEAAREQSQREEVESAERAVIEQSAKEQAANSQEAKEQAVKERAIREQAAKAAKEQAAKEQIAKEQAAKEQAAKEQAAKVQAAKEQATKLQAAKEQAAKEQAAKEQAAKEQAAKEQAAKLQAAKEQASKDQAGKAQAAVEKAAKQQSLQEHALAKASLATETDIDQASPKLPGSESKISDAAQKRVGDQTLWNTRPGDVQELDNYKMADVVPGDKDSPRTLLEEVLPNLSQPDVPDWCKRYWLPGMDGLIKEIQVLRKQIKELEKKLVTNEDTVSSLENVKSTLLSGKPGNLLASCAIALETFGWQIEASEDHPQELMLLDDSRCIAVVRSTISSGPAERTELARLIESLINFWDSHGSEPKGILIACTHCDTPVAVRQEPAFPEIMIEFAKRKNICLFTTTQLISMYLVAKLDPSQTGAIQDTILSAAGSLEGFTL